MNETEDGRLSEGLRELETRSDDEATRTILSATIEDIEEGTGEQRTLGRTRGEAVLRTAARSARAAAQSARAKANAYETLALDLEEGAPPTDEPPDTDTAQQAKDTRAHIARTIRNAVRHVEEKGIGRPLQPVLWEIFSRREDLATDGPRVHQSVYLVDRAGATLGVRYHYEHEDAGPAAEFIGAALTQAEIGGKIENVPEKVSGHVALAALQAHQGAVGERGGKDRTVVGR